MEAGAGGGGGFRKDGPLGAAEKLGPEIVKGAAEEIREDTTGTGTDKGKGEGAGEEAKAELDHSPDHAKKLGERVRMEVRSRLGRVGDEAFDEDDSAEVRILDEEDVVRGTSRVGGLWKLSLCATVSFALYVLLSGPHFEPNWIPNVTERDPIPKIYRPPRQPPRRSSSSSSSSSRTPK